LVADEFQAGWKIHITLIGLLGKRSNGKDHQGCKAE
jgi:hypothetical protein